MKFIQKKVFAFLWIEGGQGSWGSGFGGRGSGGAMLEVHLHCECIGTREAFLSRMGLALG